MKFKKLVVLNLLVAILMTVLLNNTFTLEVVADTTDIDIILLGDSRVAGMGMFLFGLPDSHTTGISSCDGQSYYADNNIYALGLGGWSIANARDTYNATLSNIANKNATIIYNMGANGLYNPSADIEYLRELCNNWQGKVYVAAVIPVTTACNTITQADVDNFNATLKSKAEEIGYTYIEPSQATTNDFIYAPCNGSYSGKSTWDGLHFTVPLYQEWLSDILVQVETGEVLYQAEIDMKNNAHEIVNILSENVDDFVYDLIWR